MSDEGHGLVWIPVQRHDDQPHLVLRDVCPIAAVLLPIPRYQHQSEKHRVHQKDQDLSYMMHAPLTNVLTNILCH